ncbi:MAG: hypothetical protein U5L09_09865 [Bacteroidales bacterium]|nr:hypothetical protein [Bacteroidales bacterium]
MDEVCLPRVFTMVSNVLLSAMFPSKIFEYFKKPSGFITTAKTDRTAHPSFFFAPAKFCYFAGFHPTFKVSIGQVVKDYFIIKVEQLIGPV